MKTWRVVTLVSFAITILMVALISLTPLLYPDTDFSWRPFLIFLIPVVVILVLLSVRQRITHFRFSQALIAAAVLFCGLALLGRMAAPVLAVALVAIVAMFLASRALAQADFGQ